MACTYSSIEIQREPEFRVFKRCLFYNLPCAEVRGSKKCPLLRRTSSGPAIAGAPATRGDEKEVLNEELRQFDNIPAVGGEYGATGRAPKEATEKTEKINVVAPRSDVDLLRAELSDFMDKMESKKEKPAISKKKEK
ncbi:MAG: hypothetical protein WED04_00965 [Promethearchaeati archaeon SRVP18_Atabeyarchaeia-1]